MSCCLVTSSHQWLWITLMLWELFTHCLLEVMPPRTRRESMCLPEVLPTAKISSMVTATSRLILALSPLEMCINLHIFTFHNGAHDSKHGGDFLWTCLTTFNSSSYWGLGGRDELRQITEGRLDVCCCHSCGDVLPGASAFYYWGLMAYLPSPISAIAEEEIPGWSCRVEAGRRERVRESFLICQFPPLVELAATTVHEEVGRQRQGQRKEEGRQRGVRQDKFWNKLPWIIIWWAVMVEAAEQANMSSYF